MENLTVGEIVTIVLSLSAFLTAIVNIKTKSSSAFEKSITNVVDPMIERASKKINNDHMTKLDDMMINVNDKLDKIIEGQELNKDALMSITADIIHEAYIKYSKLGKIDTYTYNVLSKVYDSYKKNHGNGLVKHQLEILTEIYEEGGAEL